jgi:hypothetical protein
MRSKTIILEVLLIFGELKARHRQTIIQEKSRLGNLLIRF